jgi:hypothetical protein
LAYSGWPWGAGYDIGLRVNNRKLSHEHQGEFIILVYASDY